MKNPCNRWVLSIVALTLAAAGDGRDIYVATNGPGGGVPLYGAWTSAAPRIEWAVSVGVNDDTVWISNGVYVLTNQITVNSNITIVGTGGTVVVDGNGAGRCFLFSAQATGSLANLFITGGYADQGGGVYMRNGTVRDCIFSNNVASNWTAYRGGGGMYITAGTAIVLRCTFIDNRAYWGGGLYLDSSTRNILIDNCTFHTNIAGNRAGGLYDYNNNTSTVITGCVFTCNISSQDFGGVCLKGKMTHCAIASNVAINGASSYGGGVQCNVGGLMTNCFISNNIAYRAGGGIYNEGTIKNCLIARNRTLVDFDSNYGGAGIRNGDSLVQDCTIEENVAGYYGGGIYGGGTIRNCLIRNNTAVAGGAMRRYDNGAIISSCTIVSNYSTSVGGGIYDSSSTSTGRFENCIIYFNTSGTSYSNLYVGSTVTSTFVNCCIAPALSGASTNYSTNNITSDPQFAGKDAGNWRLSRDSPSINSGVNLDWMAGAVDLDGRHRIDIYSGIVDMGCYEYLPSGMMFGVR